VRSYRLTLKIVVLRDPKEPHRLKLQGHLISFKQDGPELGPEEVIIALDDVCTWAREAFNVVFVGPAKEYDLLKALAPRRRDRPRVALRRDRRAQQRRAARDQRSASPR
jgi:hypothetical protein